MESWSVADVGEWLSFILMEQYVAIFAANEISGPILLDVTLEDLDYMNITVLGHRKVILRGAEELRRNGGKVVGGASSSSAAPASLSSSMSAVSAPMRTHSASNMSMASNDDDAVPQDEVISVL